MKNTYLKIFLIFLCFLLHSSYSGAEPWYYRYCREVYEGCASTCRTDSDVCKDKCKYKYWYKYGIEYKQSLGYQKCVSFCLREFGRCLDFCLTKHKLCLMEHARKENKKRTKDKGNDKEAEPDKLKNTGIRETRKNFIWVCFKNETCKKFSDAQISAKEITVFITYSSGQASFTYPLSDVLFVMTKHCKLIYKSKGFSLEKIKEISERQLDCKIQ